MRKSLIIIFLLLLSSVDLFFVACLPVGRVLAVVGTINSTNKYAWSNNAGWINFGCDSCNVAVSDTAITGYAWSENYGWINLNPPTSGVINTTSGVLSGYAWGENTGWINFSGVTINSSGQFAGTATGDVVGTINFSCTSTGCPVSTTWRFSSEPPGGGDTTPPVPTVISVGGDLSAPWSTTDTSPLVTLTLNENGDCRASELDDSYDLMSDDINCTGDSTTSISCQMGTLAVSPAKIIYVACEDTVGNRDTDVTNEEITIEITSLDIAGECKTNIDCGADGYTGPISCQSNDLYQDYTTWLCIKPGESDSSCSSSTEPKLKITCGSGQICESGSCVNQNNTHNECSNQQCVSVAGVAIDQCSTNNDCATPKHNECNNQQCVVVNGIGSDLCQTSSDCSEGTGTGGVCGNSSCESSEDCSSCSQDCGQCTNIPAVVKVIENKVEDVKEVAKNVKKVIETPQGSAVTKIISTVGVATGVVVATTSIAIFAPTSLFELFLIPMRLVGLLLAGFGLKKRKLPWGVVYDSVTKQPIDPAYIVLKDANGKEVASEITDMDGRYGFLVKKPGIYQIFVRKTNYAFPSKTLANQTHDELYSDLYSGEKIEILRTDQVITKNIPIDPLKFDWNEFAKRDKSLMTFYSKNSFWFKRITDILFTVGFLVAIVALFAAPYPYNMVIAGMYVVLLLLRIFGLSSKPIGHVVNAVTKTPLSFAIIRVVMQGTNVEISHQVADKYGRYYCLVPKGEYYVKIEKKNDDGSYSHVYTSPIISVLKRGIIKENFNVNC